jgi:folylpolyglutamate synthase
MDHVNLLGPSLAHIANHKAGIMRKGTICVTCEQSPDAFEVLLNESQKLSAPLEIATEGLASSVIKGLPTVAHRTNTAIAVRVVQNLLQDQECDQAIRPFDEQDVIRGLKMCRSLGSFRKISRSPHYFFLDTAHNTLSLPVALDWFDERAVSLDQQ